jgi:TonB family protein
MGSGGATAVTATPRTRLLSGAWLFSVGLHAALLLAMSLCYFQQIRLHDVQPTVSIPLDVSFLTEPCAPPDPLAETPMPPNEIPSRDWVFSALEKNEPEPAVAAVIEDEPLHQPVVELREAENVPETVRVRFDSSVVVKRIQTLNQKFAGDGGGGSQAGSGGAPAVIAAATGPGASGRGGEGNGSGTGSGSGSGSGNRPGNGAALSGNGLGNGHGDGVGSGTGGRGGGIATRPPRVRRIEPAVYPRDAQRSGYEGVAKVRIEVLESGRIGTVEVVQSSGYESLDRAACSAARLCSIEPQEEDGRPVVCSFTIPYRFTLSYK